MNTARRPLVNPRAYQRESFCKASFPLQRIHHWHGLMCLVPMTRRRTAGIELVTLGTTDTYEGLRVRIVHVDRGRVDEAVFPFADHLHERADTRADQTVPPYVWAHGTEFGWYIAVPTMAALERLMAAVTHYIEVFER